MNSGDVSALDSRLNDLENRFNNHLIDYENFNNEVINMLKSLQEQLNDKVDYNRLAELERMLMEKINDLNR